MVKRIWMSKLRYGLQLKHKVTLTEEDKKTKNLKATQRAQNKVLRLLGGSRMKDKKSMQTMLEKPNISPNQLQEAWARPFLST